MPEFLTFAAQQLLTEVASLAAQEFSLLRGVDGELANLRESLLFLQAVLRDAEHPRPDQGEATKSWLAELENLINFAYEVLDDYGYEVLRRKVELRKQMKKKVLIFFSLSNPIVFRVKMAHRIKKINTSLDKLKKDASTIGLVARPPLGVTSSDDRRIDRETFSDLRKDENNIIGRKAVVEDVVKALTNSNNNQENNLSVLAIVGMGGLGKTTLAKYVYHDAKIEQYFQEKIWACVSTPFEVNSVLRGILESLKPEHAGVQAIDAICRILKKELKEKRYLLVLDDVWNEDAHKWEELIGCMVTVNDTQGSSILVTTRKDTVAKMVETLPRCDLDKLSDDECWLILKNVAIPVGSPPINEDQEKIGREIARKCGGVPLVAKVLGNMMRSKKFEVWELIVDNVIWESPEGEDRILAVLKLSFDELGSPPLKQCFAYCSMFVKDFEFGKDDLIQHWMAQGWLHPLPNQNDLEMEDTGNEYFHILLQNTFFQDVKMDSFGNITKCKMQDLFHDLGSYVSKSKYLRSSLYNGAILARNSPEVKGLRVLNLYKTDIQELPDSIGKLKHLRYLNVMKTNIKAFPKSLGQLYNLQTLKMPHHLEEFPKEIANLINLRHIYYGDDMKLPAGVLGRLTNLRSLPFLGGPEIGELGGLNHLRDSLSIFNLEHVRNEEEAGRANLVQKKHVRKLYLQWTSSRPSNSDVSDEVVLEVLQPHSNMEFLEIQGFMGVKFPSWFLLLNNLKKIELGGCINCEKVPVLGCLPNLVHVKMGGMQNLKCLGYEFYGYDHVRDDREVLFPALKTLHIEDVENLVDWMEVPTERVKVFPCLEELTLTFCDQLSSAPSHFPSLKKLEIGCMNNRGTAVKSILSNSLTTLTTLKIWNMEGLACLPESLLENNQTLSYLEISGCSDLTCIPPPQSRCCASLQQLIIRGCPKLRYLPDCGLSANCDVPESVPIIPEKGGLPSLRELSVVGCPELSGLPDGLQYCTSLQEFEIERCPKITSIPIPSEGLPSLDRLWLSQCPELSSLPSGLGRCSSLADLKITDCPKVTSIPNDTLSTTLRDLTISHLQYFPISHGGFTSLRRLSIRDCQITLIDLQFLVSLEELSITDCPTLESVPSLDKLTSLRQLKIVRCFRLTSPPSGLTLASSPHVLTRLKTLGIGGFWNELDAFPDFHVLPQLESLTMYGWPKLTSLPEQMQHLTSLKELVIESFEGVEAIPEWLGDLTSLKALRIWNCKNLMYLPSVQAMQRLTELNVLYISYCPLLSERCRKENGPEWPKISHIPRITFF